MQNHFKTLVTLRYEVTSVNLIMRRSTTYRKVRRLDQDVWQNYMVILSKKTSASNELFVIIAQQHGGLHAGINNLISLEICVTLPSNLAAWKKGVRWCLQQNQSQNMSCFNQIAVQFCRWNTKVFALSASLNISNYCLRAIRTTRAKNTTLSPSTFRRKCSISHSPSTGCFQS